MIPNAMAREIVVGESGKAEAVSYIDKSHRQRAARLRQSLCGGGERLRDPRACC